ncbi:MlaD family protein [Mycobacterium sp. 663a-19]|uniref:MlaD family protein n=1 Tax=Mycobacterium sp. 663a-19 TaxID=2986148 RepID=UPI002D1F0244|nr:MlaD family protein [Mycobacterium sp. 663a-19]MEB3980059.1 MlaD family protein [Mycobacterium sp. 663a-19]
MLTRFIRIQLVIFTIASIVGVVTMVLSYMQVPALLGIGRITVTLELPAAGGLYRFSNVTYRGVQVGRVTAVGVTPTGAKATLSLGTSPKIPADLQAQVRSVSAVGEQYVELLPRTDSPPYLRDGSVIAMRDATIPKAVGPMLDQVSALTRSIPKDKLSVLLDELFKGFNGAGYDLSSLVDSSATVSHDLNGIADRSRTLVDDTVPLLDSQAETTDAIRTWARSLAAVSRQVVTNDAPLRTLLQNGPGAVDEASRLVEQIKPTLPVLLANFKTVGQVAVTYHASLQQLLVLYPPFVAATQSGSPAGNPTGMPIGDFEVAAEDVPPCTVGYLPPNMWRSPADTSEADTPDGVYCKLPQDSPIAVRGTRNYPCMGHPGKRAPTVEICDSDKPFEPLAMRQHALGPNPLDPNLLAQGIPPDDRITFPDRTFGPVEGTPMPPGAPPRPGAPPPLGPSGSVENPPPGTEVPPSPDNAGRTAPPPPSGVPAPPAGMGSGVPPAAPSSFTTNGSGPTPSAAVAQYDPHTGRYVGPNGHLYQQSDLVAPGTPRTWEDLILTSHTSA